MSDQPKERYAIVSPPNMDAIAQQPDFLRFQFQSSTGKWQDHFPLKNPHTKSGLSGEYPPVRAVFKVLEV